MLRLVPFLLLLAMPAGAQPAAETVLHLSETAEVTRAPDELRVTLRAEARAGSAAAAQEALNRAVAAAVARARAVAGVQVSTGAYWTARLEEPRAWQAAQSVMLRGREPAPVLELAGELQAAGLAMAGIAWGLTRETAHAAREEARRLAVEGVRQRAEAVAGQLGLSVAGIRELRLDAPGRPEPRMAPMAAASRGAAPPIAVPEDAAVGATVEAVVVLRTP
ncbi:MAG TPA: SIMPL domain-containing protein [Acetobacteraceae bacterium]|nr:SIMPL domain-containing protein [Acetobacteraceae bacterium]